MKLRNFDNFLLKESSQSNGHKEAMKLGLQYKGGGYWSDPRTGNITHQTVDGELQEYQGSDLAQNDSGGPMNPATTKDKNMQQQGTGPTQAPGQGVLKSPEPGTEQFPRGANWNPGPNGDNCVQDQPPPDDLSFDMFVGKTNYYKWVAGSEGSNYKNLDFRDFTNNEEEKPAKIREKKDHSFFTFLSENEPNPEEVTQELLKKRKDQIAKEREKLQQPMDPKNQDQQQTQEPVDTGNPTPAALGGMEPSEKAKQMGLVGDGHGSWRDKNTGQIVARTVNGELVFFDQGAGGGVVSDGAGGDKMATSQPSWQNPITGMMVVPPATPESPEEIAAVPDPVPATSPAGMNKAIDAKSRRKYADAAAQKQIDVVNAEAEEKYNSVEGGKIFSMTTQRLIDAMVNSDDEEEVAIGNHMMDVMVDSADMIANGLKDIPEDQLPEATAALRRMVEREARIRYLNGLDEEDQTEEVSEEELDINDIFDDEIGSGDLIQTDNEELQKELEDQKKEIENMESKHGVSLDGFKDSLTPEDLKKKNKFIEKVSTELENIPDETTRNSVEQAITYAAMSYTGRVNKGAGRNFMGYVDIQSLSKNRERCIKGYGDGSPEQIKKFVESCRVNKVSDEFVQNSFQLLPDKLKNYLRNAGSITGDEYKSDDLAHKNMHFLGYNEDGSIKRGKVGNNDRAHLVWKLYLQQGGVDIYTGLPLDLNKMDVEHVRGFNNKDGLEDGESIGKERWEQRENIDNMGLVNSNVNINKDELNMKEFFEKFVDPYADLKEDDERYGKTTKVNNERNRVASQTEHLSKTFIDTKSKYKRKNSKGKNMGFFSDSVTPDDLTGHFDIDDQNADTVRKQLLEVAPDQKNDINKLKGSLGKNIMDSFGFARYGKFDKKGRSLSSYSENLYRAFLISMAGADPKDRMKYYDAWEEGHRKATELRQKTYMSKFLKESGLIPEEIYKSKKYKAVFKEGYIFEEEVSWDEFKSFSMFMRKLNS